MEQIVNRRYSFVEYTFLVFCILWSGGSFTYGLFERWQYVMFIFATLIMCRKGYRIDRENLIVLIVFSIVIFLQMNKFGGGITSVIAPILGLFAVAMIAVIIRNSLTDLYVRIMAFFAFFSLIFWFVDLSPEGHTLLTYVAKGIPQFGGDILEEIEGSSWGVYQQRTLYFYTVSGGVQEDDFYVLPRNSGPFFEPGRYTIFLTIALALILFNNRFKKNKLTFFLIFITDITTFSTTGYIAMLILFIGYYIGKAKSFKISNILIFTVLYAVTYYVLQQNFISEKLNSALETTDVANTRFGAMLYHLQQIVNSPMIGYGIYLEKAFGIIEMSPCGITDMMRQWGIPIFLICVWLLYKGTKSYMSKNIVWRLSFTLIVLLLAYTQTIMNSPLYYLFYFIDVHKKENRTTSLYTTSKILNRM